MPLTGNDSDQSLGLVEGEGGNGVNDSLPDLDNFSSLPSQKDDLGEDLEIGKMKAKPDSNQTLSRALGNALVDGSKPDTSNSPKGSLPLADASNAEASTERDDRLAKAASAKNVKASQNALTSTAFTETSGFQSPLTSTGVSNTLVEQGLNDILANIANADCVNASNAETRDVREQQMFQDCYWFQAKPR